MPFDTTQPDKLVTGATVMLMRAREMIASPWKWGIGRMWSGFLFRRFCAVGAIYAAAGKYDLGESVADAHAFLNSAAREFGFLSASALNDHPAPTHAVVMAAYDRAIELSKLDA